MVYPSSTVKGSTSVSGAACTTGATSFQIEWGTTFNINRCHSLVQQLAGVQGAFLHRHCSILLFPLLCFSFTSANNVGVISFQEGCLSSHQAQEQRGGDGSSDGTRRRYWAEPISGLHSWSSSFTAPRPKIQWSLWDSLKEKMKERWQLLPLPALRIALIATRNKTKWDREKKICLTKKRPTSSRTPTGRPEAN